MNCLICLDELNCDPIKTKHCDCVLHIHPDCYYAFLRKSKFRCPICRIKKKRKNELPWPNNLYDFCINILMKLPDPLGFTLLFFTSCLFVALILPFIFFRIQMNRTQAHFFSFIYGYMILLTIKYIFN